MLFRFTPMEVTRMAREGPTWAQSASTGRRTPPWGEGTVTTPSLASGCVAGSSPPSPGSSSSSPSPSPSVSVLRSVTSYFRAGPFYNKLSSLLPSSLWIQGFYLWRFYRFLLHHRYEMVTLTMFGPYPWLEFLFPLTFTIFLMMRIDKTWKYMEVTLYLSSHHVNYKVPAQWYVIVIVIHYINFSVHIVTPDIRMLC